MLNKEKYAEELVDVACRGKRFALVGDKIISCEKTYCSCCSFYAPECGLKKEKWANSEYVEPSVDWTKVPVDTPILVKNTEDDDWTNRYFAEYKNEIVFAWYEGATSWISRNNKCPWRYAKLAERKE